MSWEGRLTEVKLPLISEDIRRGGEACFYSKKKIPYLINC
jgi:hypothetical protein